MNEQAQLFADSAERLLLQAGTVRSIQAEPDGGICRATWGKIGEAGWFRILQPEIDGGLGLSVVELAEIFREVGRQPVRGPLLESAVCAPIVAGLAQDELRALLDDVLDGQSVLAFVEPLEGHSIEPLTYVDGHLDGVVDLVPFATEADVLIVRALAKDGPVLLAVPPGVAEIKPQRSLDPCVRFASVQFRNAAVERWAPLARGEEAEAVLDTLDAVRRLMMAAEIAGGVDALTVMSVEYAKVRRQFGREIGQFQAIQHMLAALSVRSAGLTSLVRATADDVHEDGTRLRERAKIAKAYAMTVGRYAAEEAIQVHGGIGFTEELNLHLHYRRVLTCQGRLGEAATLHRELGLTLLGILE